MQENIEHVNGETATSDARSNGNTAKEVFVSRIELTPAQQQRVQHFRRQIEPLKAQAAALEQGIHAMLTTLIEMRGVPDGASYSLTEDGTALIRTAAAN